MCLGQHLNSGPTVVALERAEEKHGLQLSRSIAFPNIASKGKLDSRSVVVPVYGSWASTSHITAKEELPPPYARHSTKEETGDTNGKPLIEELGSTLTVDDSTPAQSGPGSEKPVWSLTKLKDDGIRIDIEMPKMVGGPSARQLID